ncbi:MAG: hypothetical protein AAF721_37320 [Myxococcota bacterium]
MHGLSCGLQLDSAIACGDGFVDRDAGEECDPLNEESFINACAGTSRPDGVGRCDPVECTLIRDREQCAICGDGEIDGEEQCDEDNLGGQRCPAGDDAVQCDATCRYDFSLCETCGDREVDFSIGEECDKANMGGLVANKRPCAGKDIGLPGEVLPLTSPIPNLPYTFGDAILCTEDCKLSRLGCSYCNNGRRDPPTALDLLGNLTAQEVCDGDNFDLNDLFEEFPNSGCESMPQLRPNVGCADDCLGYVPRPDEPACCVQSGAPCVEDGEPRCCSEYAHPGEPACELFINARGEGEFVCR